MPRPSGQTVGVGVGILASLAVGAAMGMATERLIVGRTFRHDPDRDEPFGQMRSPSHRVVLPDGVSLHVEVDEPADFRQGVDPTIVFAHGFGLNQDAWHYQRRDLAGQGRLVFYDQRSHGRSDRAPNGTHTIDQLGHDLAAVVADTAGDGPVILVGHSMGGMTVMSLVQHYTHLIGTQVKGVGLIATSPGGLNTVTLGLPRSAAKLLHRYAEDAAAIMGAQQPLIDPVRARVNDLAYLLTKIYSFGGWSSPSMTRFVNDLNASTPADVLADFIPTLMQHDKLESLELLQQIPTTVVVGDHDLLTPVSHSEEILRKVPNAKFTVLPESGHMVLLERHADVNLRLRQMIALAKAG
jgi:pimeloyl-ACP methyl ester carboxylesterase